MLTRIFLLLSLFLATSFTPAAPPFPALKRLLAEKQYFKARTFYEQHKNRLSLRQQHYAQAFLESAFNRLEASNTHIDFLLRDPSAFLKDSDRIQLLRLEQANWGKRFAYAKAAKVLEELLHRFSAHLTPAERADDLNTLRIWKALSATPPQTLRKNGATCLALQRDRAGLPNLPVQAGDTTIPFVFDTGANLSTITTATARRLGVQLLGDSIQVGSITGATVQAQVGQCPRLQLGAIEVRHMVVLVLPDSALAFPQIGYQIQGILGFPFIEACQELTITRSDSLLIPQVPSSSKTHNLALDFLTLVVELNGEAYTFDSGATTTLLYGNYFTKYRSQILGRYKEQALSLGGAGGASAGRGYQVRFQRKIEGQQVTLDSVYLFPANRKREEAPYFGNIGQDLIRKFPSVTLNFSSMFLRFNPDAHP